MTGGPVRQVAITEVLLRDGFQIEPALIPAADKIQLGRALLDAGLPALEVGAFVDPRRVPQMADSAEVAARLRELAPASRLYALVFNERGARRAVKAGVRQVRFVVSASDGHSVANAGVDTAGALRRLEPAAEILRAAGVAIEASIATAFICPYDGEIDPERTARVAAALAELGASPLHLADTIGAASPWHIERTVAAVRRACPDVTLGLHLHDTYGMASANAWTGIQLGIRHFDASLGGIGGCPFAPGAAGNIATDDLVNMLHHAGIATGVDVDRLVTVRDQLQTLLGRRLDSALSAAKATPARLRSQD